MTSDNERSSKDKFLQKCRGAWKKISELRAGSDCVVTVDIPALFLTLWGASTLFGVWENGGWYLPDEFWRVVAVLVLMYCSGKVILIEERSQ